MSLILIFTIVVVAVYFVQAKWKLYMLGSSLPGPWALPLMGNVQMIAKLRPQDLFRTFAENRAKYRQSYRLWLGPQLWVFLHSPAETRDALNDPTLTRPATFQQLQMLIGNGLLISHGKYWENQRRALTPAFHPNILHSFTPTITNHADQLVHKLLETHGRSIEISDILFCCILDVIIDTSMGKRLNALSVENCRYTQAFHKASELLFKRMINPLLGFDCIFNCTKMARELHRALHTIHGLMDTVIAERALTLKQQHSELNSATQQCEENDFLMNKKRLTLLDTLLMAEIDGRSLTPQEIRDEVNTFVFAGVDTTTAAMCFVLYSLAKYPEEQRKLLAEIESIEPVNGRHLTTSDINRLVYLDMFIKEVLRFYTIVPLTGRQTTCDTVIAGREYCAGVTIWIDMYGLAHDAQYFDSPEQFQPARFARETQQKLTPYCYIPFSGGPHMCIGRKYALLIMKVLTVRVLQNFELHLRDPNEELVLMAQMVLKSLHGINLKFVKRVENV